MKFIYKAVRTLSVAACLSTLASCDLTNLDISVDPNNPTNAAPNLVLASVELNVAGFFETINQNAHGFVGILASADSYNLNNNSYNGTWNYFYETPAKDIDGLIRTAEAAGNTPRYLGIAQTLKAYMFGMMVDAFGDVPYTESLNGDIDGNINPKFDDSKTVYENLIKLCDDAVTNLNTTSAEVIQGDIIYGGTVSKWRKLAKTVKLRLLINSSRVMDNKAAIQAILTEGDYITLPADDFLFRYNRLNTPEGRHPWYQAAYAAANNGFTYILHQYMYEMLRDDDPRLPFYFKRQYTGLLNADDPSERSTIPCSQATGCRYAYWVYNPFIWQTLLTNKGKTNFTGLVNPGLDSAYIAGFFGRDRGDISGVPQDVDFRTAPGAYPAGGQYDVIKYDFVKDASDRDKDGNKEEVIDTVLVTTRTGGVNANGSGDGISPMITSWMTKFYQIEAILALGVSGDARSVFEAAIKEQMAKVESVGLAADPSNAVAMSATAKQKYIDLYLARYDAAPSNAAKLNVVLKQAWFSNYGNGYEVWNAFRRTGYPNDIQIPIARYRNFALRLPYPAQELSLNANAPKTPPQFDKDKLFWDTIGFQFQ